MLYPKGQAGPMQGAAQIDSYTIMIMAAYTYIEKEKKSVRYERWHAHDLTSDQVHGRSASNVVCKRFVKVCFKKVLKNAGTRKATFRLKFTRYVP